MTEREALKLALEKLKDNQHLVADNERHVYVMEYNSIIEKCEEALAQPEQEPVRREQKMFMEEQEFYATPQQRTWVGLTDEEKLVANQMWRVMDADGFIKAIEAKLKEKNT